MTTRTISVAYRVHGQDRVWCNSNKKSPLRLKTGFAARRSYAYRSEPSHTPSKLLLRSSIRSLKSRAIGNCCRNCFTASSIAGTLETGGSDTKSIGSNFGNILTLGVALIFSPAVVESRMISISQDDLMPPLLNMSMTRYKEGKSCTCKTPDSWCRCRRVATCWYLSP